MTTMKFALGMRRRPHHVTELTEWLTVRNAALESVIAELRRELLSLKGPCGNRACSLHHAHSGPCVAP